MPLSQRQLRFQPRQLLLPVPRQHRLLLLRFPAQPTAKSRCGQFPSQHLLLHSKPSNNAPATCAFLRGSGYGPPFTPNGTHLFRAEIYIPCFATIYSHSVCFYCLSICKRPLTTSPQTASALAPAVTKPPVAQLRHRRRTLPALSITSSLHSQQLYLSATCFV